MKFRLDTFDSYFASTRETESELFEGEAPLVGALRSYHEFFVDHVFAEGNSMSPVQTLLSLHAFMMYLSSMRVAMSGHVAATFPLFRTAMEASCYAFRIGEMPELQQIWLDRNSTDQALRLCKSKFRTIETITDTARAIQAQDWASTTTEDWIVQAYDAAIDFGAHPNPKSVFPYVDLYDGRADEYVGVTLGTVYGASSPETYRALIACLDYGLVIAHILVACCGRPSDRTLSAFNELNKVKEDFVERYTRDNLSGQR